MNSHLHPNWSADLSTLMQSVHKLPLNFLIWLFYLPRLSRTYRRWGWKGEPRLFRMEWKTPSQFGSNHTFPVSSLLPHNKPTRNSSRFSKAPFSVWQLANALSPLPAMPVPLLHVAKFYSTFRDKFQPLLGKAFPDSYLFFPSQTDYLPLQRFIHSKRD